VPGILRGGAPGEELGVAFPPAAKAEPPAPGAGSRLRGAASARGGAAGPRRGRNRRGSGALLPGGLRTTPASAEWPWPRRRDAS
jgi:hypothetical protein